MPELPEVETISRQLKTELGGKEIKSVEITDSYRVFPSREVFVNLLKGLEIKDVTRIAKVIVCTLSKKDAFLTFHLAMTGRLLYRKNESKEDLHLRVRLVFNNSYELRFCDLRMFGYAKVINQVELKNLKLKYGPTPFHKDLNAKKLLELLKKKKTQIKRILLEQDVISGLGNIYANDSLWISGIHPETLTSEITLEQAEKLLAAMREILKEGIFHKGATLDDLMYVDIYGNTGSHQNHLRVYGKAGKPCPTCNTKIEMVVISGRGTFFCPNCQKKKSKEDMKLL